MRERLTALGIAVPALGAGHRPPRRSTAFGDDGRLADRRQDPARRLRRQGRARSPRRPTTSPTGSPRIGEPGPLERGLLARGEGRLRARARRPRRPQPVRPGRGLARRRDGPDRRRLHRGARPRPGARPGPRRRWPPRSHSRIAGELGVTGVLAVEMFEVRRRRRAARRRTSSTSWRCARTTAVTGRWTAPSPASSSSTCAPCSTCRSATRARGRRGPSWPTCSAATTSTSTRAYRHIMARDPGAKVHVYGKGVRPGRKIGHVNVSRRRPRRRPRARRRTPPTTSAGVITE